MIKKIVLAALSGLSIYIIYSLVMTGDDFLANLPLNINISSYKELLAQGDELNNKLKEIENLNNSQLVLASTRVEQEIAGFETKKEEYTELESSASEAEIAEANKKQEYLLDYLWIVIGNYANDNDVKFKMQTDNVNLRINFDITGSYVSIINFIYDLENDENLKFNLNGIKMASSVESDDSTKASFSVDGVTVKTSNIVVE